MTLVEQLRKAADEMRAEDQNGWPLTCDAAADDARLINKMIFREQP